MPVELEAYLHHNGMHFNRKLCDWAVGHMRKTDANGKRKRIDAWEKDRVDKLLESNNVELERNAGYDAVYVCNMCVADHYKGSVTDEAHLALFVKEMVDDADQQDGFIFNRFVADCDCKGVPIPWDEVL